MLLRTDHVDDDPGHTDDHNAMAAQVNDNTALLAAGLFAFARPLGVGYGYFADAVTAGAVAEGDLAAGIVWARANSFTTLVLSPFRTYTVQGACASPVTGLYGHLGTDIVLKGYRNMGSVTIIKLADNIAPNVNLNPIVTITATGGTMTFTVPGKGTTTALAPGASLASIAAALNTACGTTHCQVFGTVGSSLTIYLDQSLPQSQAAMTVNTSGLTGGTATIATNGTNPYHIVMSEATTTRTVLTDVTLDGGTQTNEYNGCRSKATYAQSTPTYLRVTTRNILGSKNTPPHETYGLALYTGGGQFVDCEADGSGVGALGLAANGCTGKVVLRRCTGHDSVASHGFSAWRSSAPIEIHDSRFWNNGGVASNVQGAGINCEESSGTADLLIVNTTCDGNTMAGLRIYLSDAGLTSRLGHRVIGGALIESPNGILVAGNQTDYPGIENATVSGTTAPASGGSTTSVLNNAPMHDYMRPSGVFASSMPRVLAHPNTAITVASGTRYMQAIGLQAGIPVGHLAFTSVGASTPTNWWFELWDAYGNLLARTADQTTTAWAASTRASLAIAAIASGAASTFTSAYTGLYYVGVVQVGTPATLMGGALTSSKTIAELPVAFGSADTGLVAMPTFPTVAASLTAIGSVLAAEIAA